MQIIAFPDLNFLVTSNLIWRKCQSSYDILQNSTLSGSTSNSPSPFPFNLQPDFSLPIIYSSLPGICPIQGLATHMFYSVMDTTPLNICLAHSLPLGLCSFIITSEASLTTQYKNRITLLFLTQTKLLDLQWRLGMGGSQLYFNLK